MKNLTFLLVLLLAVSADGTGTDSHDLVKKLVDRALENDRASEDYGFNQQTVVREFDSKGNLKKKETRTYQTVWIENQPYAELLKVNGRLPNESEKKEETKRRKKFVDSLHNKKPKEDDSSFNLKWDDLSQKYDFTELPSDDASALILHFEPKAGDLQERSRVEKVFNNMSGTVWADSDYDLLKAETSLVRSVKFGLGIVAKLDKLDISYTQTQYEAVFLPEHFQMKLSLRIALFKTANQEVDITFSDYYHRPAS